jgi:hypothetical protein
MQQARKAREVSVNYLHNCKYILAIALLFSGADYSHAPTSHWKEWSIDSSGDGADGVHTGDINRDGFIDVVSGWEQSGDIMLYLNPGRKQVKNVAAWPRTDISGELEIEGIEDAAFADLDLDGFPDAVISSIEGETKTIGLHFMTGFVVDNLKNWRAAVLTPDQSDGYMKARAGQIDGSGGADIVAGTKTMDGDTAAIYWFKSPLHAGPHNDLEWQRFYVGEVDVKTVTLALSYMDADGLLDIVYSGRNGVGWFKNPGHGALTSTPGHALWERIIIADTGSEFALCDPAGRGTEDLIITSSKKSATVANWFKRLDGTGRHWQAYPIASDDERPGKMNGKKFVLKGIACGYVDDDEKIDVVFSASGHGHGVFMMSPRTDIASGEPWELTNITLYADNIKYDNLELVDIDRDGDLDIVTSEEGGGPFSAGEGVLWYENPLYSLQ